jgi:lysophospholipase L1-like esterase
MKIRIEFRQFLDRQKYSCSALLPLLLIAGITLSVVTGLRAQPAGEPDESTVHRNAAVVPVSRTGGITNRQAEVLQRAKDNPGPCDIVFLGDSITQRWEREGQATWAKYYGDRKCLNFGVGGDRTQHVLWRIANGQLEGVRPKVAVLMIGTNNSKDDDPSDILAGVRTIVQELRTRLPDTKVLVLGIFPRGETFNGQRAKLLQVNQALARLADGKMVHYLDFGSQLIEDDGSIRREIMSDFLHPTARGYEIWAAAMEPKLKELLSSAGRTH